MKKVLILCTGNSCRSQMAEGYLRHFTNGRVEVYSAGIETHGVNPRAVAVMEEDGIDLTRHTSNNVLEYRDVSFDHVLTVCDSAKELCPVFPGATSVYHHSFPDPAKALGTEKEIMEQFRAVRDEIKAYCRNFASELIG